MNIIDILTGCALAFLIFAAFTCWKLGIHDADIKILKEKNKEEMK